MKKKWVKYTLIVAVVIVAVVGGKVFMDQQAKKEMIRIVYGDEAKKVFEEGLKNLDENAFTELGVIQSYKIDKKSIKHNPMGGINVTLHVNEDSSLYVFFTLNKNNDGILVDDGGGNSSTLEKMLEDK